MGLKVSFTGTEKLLKALPDPKKVEKRVEKKLRRFAAGEGKRGIEEATPVKSGRLKGNWRAPRNGPLLTNDTPYAEDVIGRRARGSRNKTRFSRATARFEKQAQRVAEDELREATKAATR